MCHGVMVFASFCWKDTHSGLCPASEPAVGTSCNQVKGYHALNQGFLFMVGGWVDKRMENGWIGSGYTSARKSRKVNEESSTPLLHAKVVEWTWL